MWWLIACYLLAAVGANLSVAALGPGALWATALLLIPFDLTARDVLHDRWHGRGLLPRMSALVAAGSLLSMLASQSSARVAAASFCAFAVAGLVDCCVYSAAGRRSRMVRMNLSNVASALVDSIAFPLVAWGLVDVGLSGTQWATKVVGGLLWSVVLRRLEVTRCA